MRPVTGSLPASVKKLFNQFAANIVFTCMAYGRAQKFWPVVAAVALAFVTLAAHAQRHRPLLVGYFPQWGLYYDQPYYVKNLIMSGSARRLDQINYAQGFVTSGRCSVADPNADLNTVYTHANSVNGVPDDPNSPFRGYFHQLRELKRRYPHLRILISLEGNATDFAHDAQPENRRAFVASCVDVFLKGHFAPGVNEPGLFDGIDIDWESPHQEDAANFHDLIAEFRHQMDATQKAGAAQNRLTLSIAVGHMPHMLAGTDFRTIAPLVDEVGVMNYDYTGPWNQRTGLLAPLFTDPANGQAYSIERSMADYQAAGVPRSKLLMGLPFYGYSWTAVPAAENGLFQVGKSVHDDQPYHNLRDLGGPFELYRDQRSKAPWLYDGHTFWTYEDPVSIRYKASYAARQQLGGVMIWELSEDTTDAELLNVTHRALHRPMARRTFPSQNLEAMAQQSSENHASR